MKKVFAWLDSRRLDLGLGLAFFVLALAVRLPNLYLIPRFTDEVLEWMFAFEIAQGQRTIWQGVQPYFGPLEPDLLALALRLDPNPYLPRALALVMGALTVPATFALASVVGGRRAGAIAALLMATSSIHIVTTSHVAYNNSLSPLMVTLALVLFYLARRFASGKLVIGAGLASGFAAHTHPIVLTILPGIAIWFLLPRAQWHWFRRPSLWLAVGAALLAYSPVLGAVIFRFENFSGSVGSRNYAFAPVHSIGEYLVNVQALLVELGRMLGAVYPNLHAPREYLAQPLVAAYVLGVLVAVAAMLERRNYFFIPLIAAPFLLIPLFNAQYGDFPYFTRYVAFLLPPIYAAIGFGLSTAWQRISGQFSMQTTGKAVARAGIGMLFLIGLGWLFIYPLFLTENFYASQVRGLRTNAPLLNLIERVEQEPGRMVWLDPALRAGEFPGGGSALFVFQMWFKLRGIRSQPADPALLCASGAGWLIATDMFSQQMAAQCPIERVFNDTITTRPGFDALHFGLYRVSE